MLEWVFSLEDLELFNVYLINALNQVNTGCVILYFLIYVDFNSTYRKLQIY